MVSGACGRACSFYKKLDESWGRAVYSNNSLKITRLLLKHLLIDKNKGIQSLVLGRSGDISLYRYVGEERCGLLANGQKQHRSYRKTMPPSVLESVRTVRLVPSPSSPLPRHVPPTRGTPHERYFSSAFPHKPFPRGSLDVYLLKFH